MWTLNAYFQIRHAKLSSQDITYMYAFQCAFTINFSSPLPVVTYLRRLAAFWADGGSFAGFGIAGPGGIRGLDAGRGRRGRRFETRAGGPRLHGLDRVRPRARSVSECLCVCMIWMRRCRQSDCCTLVHRGLNQVDRMYKSAHVYTRQTDRQAQTPHVAARAC